MRLLPEMVAYLLDGRVDTAADSSTLQPQVTGSAFP
jgi:hypothetical protein